MNSISLGPLDPLLEDLTVTEIMVNGWNSVFVERNNQLYEVPGVFQSQQELWNVVEILQTLVEAGGLRLDVRNPIADIRLSNLARCHVVLPPIAPDGPAITIRRFLDYELTADDLLRFDSWSSDIAQFLRACVAGRLNIVVAGGTASGKTTLLSILIGMIPPSERIITIRNARDFIGLRPPAHLKHVVRLETRPPDADGQGEVTIRDLVINTMLMRPDRIVMAEVHGSEALDILEAMTTGHDGSMFSIHSSGIQDVLLRLETMVAMNNLMLPVLNVRGLLADAIDLIVYHERLVDGSRRIIRISEVSGIQGDTILTQDLFEYHETGITAEGQVEGYFTATGRVPTFWERFEKSHLKSLLQAEGIDLSLNLFKPKA
jgi:pilus assembly protein CpaF